MQTALPKSDGTSFTVFQWPNLSPNFPIVLLNPMLVEYVGTRIVIRVPMMKNYGYQMLARSSGAIYMPFSGWMSKAS